MFKINNNRKFIVLTGGPDGGKTTLIKELLQKEDFQKQFVALPEAIFNVLQTGISVKEKRFQKAMVEVQIGMEAALDRTFDNEIIICHRGTLDPLAYWLKNSWARNEFFEFTKTDLKTHYQRYNAVIHLQTVASNSPKNYKRYPHAHRGETPEQANILDKLLYEIWCKHPNFHFIESNKDWYVKKKQFFNTLNKIIKH